MVSDMFRHNIVNIILCFVYDFITFHLYKQTARIGSNYSMNTYTVEKALLRITHILKYDVLPKNIIILIIYFIDVLPHALLQNRIEIYFEIFFLKRLHYILYNNDISISITV